MENNVENKIRLQKYLAGMRSLLEKKSRRIHFSRESYGKWEGRNRIRNKNTSGKR